MAYQLAYRTDGSLAFWGVEGAYVTKPNEKMLTITDGQFDALNATHSGVVTNKKLVLTELPVAVSEDA